MAVVKTMGWDEEKNQPVTANEYLLDKILEIPTPDSALGQMFDFSEMELDSTKKGAEVACLSCSSLLDDDTASKGSDMFSQLSTFSRFYNPDGMEQMATDQRVEWMDLGGTDTPKEVACTYFQTAVDATAQCQQAIAMSQIKEQKHQLEQQSAQMAEMQRQMEKLLTQQQQQAQAHGNGDDISAPPVP